MATRKPKTKLPNLPNLPKPPGYIDQFGRLHLCDSTGVEEFVCEYNSQTRKYYVNGVEETDPEMIANMRADFRDVVARASSTEGFCEVS